MSDENNETLADIVAELRSNGKIFSGAYDIMLESDFADLADRIEAAARRLEADALNCGAMVEAMRKPRRNFDRFKTADEARKAYKATECFRVFGGKESIVIGWLYSPADGEEEAK